MEHLLQNGFRPRPTALNDPMSNAELSRDFGPFDRGALPSAFEMDGELGIEQFEAAQQQQQRSFADTVPFDAGAHSAPVRAADRAGEASSELLPNLALPGPAGSSGTSLGATNSACAPTAPSTLAAMGSLPLVPGTVDAELGVSEAMVLCRRFGRVAPRPEHWEVLIQRLQSAAGQEPAVTGAAELAKKNKLLQRIALRDLLVWAAERGLLAAAVDFLEQLPEPAWTHMES